MLLPVKPLDFEVTRPRDVEVGDCYRSARVLVRWMGVPIGKLDVPVMGGWLRASEVGARALRELSDSFGREMMRRALLVDGIDASLLVSDCWTKEDSRSPRRRLSVSVIVCTRDRPDDVEKCLASLSRLREKPLEILLVDNAPTTDATKILVVEQFSDVRYIREETPGLDHARNRGIRESHGDIVAYTDDDVEVDAGWTAALHHAFAEDDSVGLVTGLVEPAEQETEAQVLFEDYGGFGRGWTRTYLQSRRGQPMTWDLVGAGQLGAGANMAVRRKLLHETGCFDPALDVGTPTLGGGDHEIFFRFLKSGWICLYEPKALVRHRHRRTMDELRRLLFSYGHATRCYFDRETLNFPEDEAAVKKLRRWWWKHWARNRWLRAFWSKGWFPPELVKAEVEGYIKARGAYAKARKEIVADESQRPDMFFGRIVGRDDIRSVKVVSIDLAKPLSDLEVGKQWMQIEVVATFRGKPLGRLRMNSHGRVIPVDRLADRLADAFWFDLLNLFDSDPSLSWARFHADLGRQLRPSPVDAEQLDVDIPATIVVPTCGRVDDLRRCLESLMAQETTRPVKVIVVDNRPELETESKLAEDFPQVEWITESRPGSSYARNAGLAVAPGEILAMTDDDMVVAPDWLEKLVAPFVRNDVIAVTGSVLPGSLETNAERDFETYGGFQCGSDRTEFGASWFRKWRYRAVPTWKLGGTGNLAIRAEFLERKGVGYFMECLGAGVPAGVGEDTLFFYRVMLEGGTIIYEPEAVGWHFHRAKSEDLRRQLFSYARGHVAYHLVTLIKFGDRRALTRLLYELPGSYLQRIWDGLRGHCAYPWNLLATEIVGTLCGPFALWQSWRYMKGNGEGYRRWKYYGAEVDESALVEFSEGGKG
ncbi:glycosyltransferase family 2 protein [Haloferula sp.]|uniref:glycosyltransferase family 2 protein n=1 Tax=Haloferula sp. TaxID=2497595 RepID=UPI00329C3CFC